jgi:hypothetical protein
LSEINERRHIPAVPIKIIARAGKTETDVIDLDITLITRRRREDIDRMGIGSASLTLVYGVLHASPAARYFLTQGAMAQHGPCAGMRQVASHSRPFNERFRRQFP